MEYRLPYGIRVVVSESMIDRSRLSQGCGRVSSSLRESVGTPVGRPHEQHRIDGRVEALETFLLALACAGVNIESKEFLRALDGTVRTLASDTAQCRSSQLQLQQR